MHLGTTTRLVTLVLGSTVVVLAALGVGFVLERRDVARVEAFQTQLEARTLLRCLDASLERPRAFSLDYSFWDEMVAFTEARRPDRDWQRTNLEPALTSLQADAVWVFRADGAPVAQVFGPDDASLGQIDWPAATTRGLMAERPLHEFFVATPEGVVALFTASVVPSGDTARATPARGLLVVGRRLDGDVLSGLASTLDTTVEIVAPDLAVPPAEAGQIRNTLPLLGQDGAPVAQLTTRSTSPLVTSMTAALQRTALVLVGFTLVCAGIVALAVRRWVVAPVHALAEALATASEGPLAGLVTREDEFGDLSRLIVEFFDQKRALVEQSALREERARAFHHEATHDPLTRLPNRTLLAERLHAALERRAELAVLALDLNGFKAVNDSLGHAAGDDLLVSVAHRLAAAVRASDLVVRLGGDEFVVVLPGCKGDDGARTAAARIEEILRAPFVIGNSMVRVTASIGACTWPDRASSADELLERADQAMYEAKRHGLTGLWIWGTSAAGTTIYEERHAS